MAESELKVGQRVRVQQRIDRREGDWCRELIGTVVSIDTQKTGSWFVHGKDAKLWLRRILLRKDDGELTSLCVDASTRIEPLSEDGRD